MQLDRALQPVVQGRGLRGQRPGDPGGQRRTAADGRGPRGGFVGGLRLLGPVLERVGQPWCGLLPVLGRGGVAIATVEGYRRAAGMLTATLVSGVRVFITRSDWVPY